MKRPGSRSLAFCWAMRALVLAGLPTTRTFTSFLAERDSASPCGLKIPPLALSRSERSIPSLRGMAPTSRATSMSPKATSASSVWTIPARSGNAQSSSSIATPPRARQGRGDLEHLEDHGLVGAEHRARGDPEQEGVPDLPGSSGDGDPYGGVGGHVAQPSDRVREAGKPGNVHRRDEATTGSPATASSRRPSPARARTTSASRPGRRASMCCSPRFEQEARLNEHRASRWRRARS